MDGSGFGVICLHCRPNTNGHGEKVPAAAPGILRVDMSGAALDPFVVRLAACVAPAVGYNENTPVPSDCRLITPHFARQGDVSVKHRIPATLLPVGLALTLSGWTVHQTAGAQDRLKTMPGYEHYRKMAGEIPGAIKSGALGVTWKDGKTFDYVREGKLYRYDVTAKFATEMGPPPASAPSGRGGRGAGLERGRQAISAESPDKKLKAFYRARNLWLSDAAGASEAQITTDGSEADRIKYGTASWVYGEELSQTSAMWWSPDSTRIAYYRFDEKQVPDYHLQLDQTKLQSKDDIEAYPKAGAPNPIVDLYVYDVAAKQSTRIDVRGGKPFDNASVGHYVYRIAWSPDGRELLFNRTNRRQNILEYAAANPATGATRVILREEWPTGWIENNPAMHFLKDGRRFIWESSRNGWSNLYLYDLSGRLIAPLTNHSTFEVGNVIKIDEAAGLVFYTARDGDNYMKLQLHRVGLDGSGDVRLTDRAYHHVIAGCTGGAAGGGRAGGLPGGGSSCGISPDNKYFVDVYQTHDTPPATRLVDATTGRPVAELAQSDLTKFSALGLKKAELFTYKAADGKTTLHGILQFPSNFDPARQYPTLLSVYGGPDSSSNTARETFVTPSPTTEYGFLVLNLASRAAPGQGKRLLDQVYMKLGQVEIDDMAEGIKSLWTRPYFDRTRVGVHGTSYGGYAAVMLLLRQPDVFAAASASSPVTAWYHYDSVYTERYMWLPDENRAGYDAGSAMTYAKNLKGRLMLYYATADNNVHPSNVMQLISVLQQAGKSFEVQVGPDRPHSGINPDRMMEFFIENLIMRPSVPASTSQP
jgi:dipeptidyl-peptidase 4